MRPRSFKGREVRCARQATTTVKTQNNAELVESLPKTPRGEPENKYSPHLRKYHENSAGSRFKTGTSFDKLVKSARNCRGISNRQQSQKTSRSGRSNIWTKPAPERPNTSRTPYKPQRQGNTRRKHSRSEENSCAPRSAS